MQVFRMRYFTTEMFQVMVYKILRKPGFSGKPEFFDVRKLSLTYCVIRL